MSSRNICRHLNFTRQYIIIVKRYNDELGVLCARFVKLHRGLTQPRMLASGFNYNADKVKWMRAFAINIGNELDIFSSVTFRSSLSYQASVLDLVYYISCISL